MEKRRFEHVKGYARFVMGKGKRIGIAANMFVRLNGNLIRDVSGFEYCAILYM
jgi:hypothetical protein